MSERTATFAGFLGLSDAVMADGLVSIDIRPRDILSSLTPESAQQIRHAAGEHGLNTQQLQGGGIALDGNGVRSPRPFTIITTGWDASNAGLGAEDVGRRFAEHIVPLAAESVPGDALECWLLPVVSFQFDYLITPAGDWPPLETADE